MFRKILRHRLILTALVIIGVVLVLVLAGLTLLSPPEEEIQGQVEATEYRVSAKIPARVDYIYVREGQAVRRGDTLATLSAPDIMAKREQARSALDAVQEVERQTLNGTREEQIRGAHERWKQARAQAEVARKSYQRTKNLHAEGVVTAQKHDEVKAQYDAAQAAEEAARAAYEMALNGSRSEEKRAAMARTQQMKGTLEEVNSYASETVLRASADGTVSEIYPEVGELLGSGGRLMTVSTADYWFTFNLTEDKLPGIEVGRAVRVFVPATGETINGQVSLIKNVGNFVAWKATRALKGYDLKVFEVQVRPNRQPTNLRPGMSAVLKSS